MDAYYEKESALHNAKIKESQKISTEDSIKKLMPEVELLKLEKAWCYDTQGKRIKPSAEEQALKISLSLAEFPHLVDDTVKALRMKKIELQSNLKELERRTEEIGSTS